MSAEICVRDGTAYLSIDDGELAEKIDAATSFKAVGVEFTGRRGDGLTHLVRNSKAPVGLLERICRVIAAHGETPQLSYADTQRAVKPRVPMRLYDVELRDYQQELEVAVALENRGIIRAPTGCLVGDTIIHVSRGGKCFPVKLEDAFYRFNHVPREGRPGYCPCGCGVQVDGRRRRRLRNGRLAGQQYATRQCRSRTLTWDSRIETRCRALADGELRQLRVEGIVDSGLRPTVRVTLASGKVLRCTPDHQIRTPDGWQAAGWLSPGDIVLANGRFYDKDGYVWVTRPNTWRDHPAVHHDGKGGYAIREHHLVMEQVLGRPVNPQVGDVVHHVNEIKDDNRPENLELHTTQSHGQIHGDRTRFHNIVHPHNSAYIQVYPHEDVVLSVVPAGVHRTFDIQMEAPHHNFVADGIVVHNSGKTLMAAQIAVATGMHTVIIVPTIDLLRQTRQYLADHLARAMAPIGRMVDVNVYGPQWKIGQLGDGVVDPQPVTVATIRTMAKVLDVAYERYKFAEYDDTDDTSVDRASLRVWVDSLGTVVVDEAHQLGARVLYDTVGAIPAPNKYGMSASPWRDDGADLMIEAATGPCIFHVTCQRLVDAGYLMAPEIHVIDTSRWWTSAAWGQVCKHCHRQWLTWTKECHCGCRTFRSQYDESYKKEVVDNPIYNLQIGLEAQKWYRPGFPVMVLVKQVGHGKQLAQVLESLGVVSTFLSGKDTGAHRQQVLDDLRADRVQAVVLTTIGDQGIDVPNLGALILGGGGKSSTRHLQRIGRTVRTAPGKPRPVIVEPDLSHIHPWYSRHIQKRSQIVEAEWGDLATWIQE